MYDKSEYYQNNKAKFKINYDEHREERLIQNKIYRENNKERIKKYHKDWLNKPDNRVKWNAYQRQSMKKQYKQAKYTLFNFLGNKCTWCGILDKRVLELDHIKDDGEQDRAKLNGRIHFYYAKHLDEAKEKLQILCCNCNRIKKYERQTSSRHLT